MNASVPDASPTTPRPAIETRGLAKHFGGVEAARSIDLSVPRRSIFGLLGPNGAGKSTTMRMLVGLLKPTAGSGSVLGLELGHPDLRLQVGYLPQQPRFYPDLSARETLRFVGRFFYRPGAALDRRIQDALDLVGLAERADRPVGVFSGGERQRLGIAQAQLHDPRLLILDEPAAGLDPLGRRDVLDLLRTLRETTTVVYSTHILDDVQRVSDMVAIVHQGAVVAHAPLDELLSDSEGAVYRLRTTGPIDAVLTTVRARPWVNRVEIEQLEGAVHWRVKAGDQEAAETELLRLLLAEPLVRVIEFGRERHELEDVFVRVVEENGS